jgi:DNA modification methylase
MSVTILRGDTRQLPLADTTVDLIVTSPPYWALRSYTDGGEHYDGQIGAEPTPAAYIDSLIQCTAEWMRVLKPGGSIWVNLGDKYSTGNSGQSGIAELGQQYRGGGHTQTKAKTRSAPVRGMPAKSLLLLPERYRIACVDQLGLIARAVVIWDKPNGLPESVTDRVRRSHEDWVHLVKQPRYFAAVDTIREPHADSTRLRVQPHRASVTGSRAAYQDGMTPQTILRDQSMNALGKLPGSVRTVATQPLKVPAELGIDHFAAFPMDWPRWIIQGWSPAGICTACGEGRQPVTVTEKYLHRPSGAKFLANPSGTQVWGNKTGNIRSVHEITGEACACPDTDAPTVPATVLDPFGGTGTTALVADALGRHGISVDMSADYCRLATWRTTDPGQRAAARQVDKPPAEHAGQLDLFAAAEALT